MLVYKAPKKYECYYKSVYAIYVKNEITDKILINHDVCN